MIYLLAATLASLPLMNTLVQVEVGVITFNLYMMLLSIVAIGVIFQVSVGRLKYQFGATEALALAVGCSFMVSTFNSSDVIISGFLAFHSIFVPFISFFCVKALVQTEKKYNLAFFTMILVFVGFGLANAFTFFATLERSFVFGVAPIGAATMLLVPALFFLLSGDMQKKYRLLGLVASGVGLLSTLARAYIFYFVVAKIPHRIVRKGKAFPLMAAFLVASLVLTLILIGVSAVLKDFASVKIEGERGFGRLVDLDYWMYALYGRALSYMEGFELFLNDPFFGVGLYRAQAGTTRHNFCLEWLEYGGLFGYLLYFWLFCAHAKKVARWCRVDVRLAINFTVVLGILLNSLTNGFMHGFMPYVSFVVMGFSEARVSLLRREAIRKAAESRRISEALDEA